MATTYSIGTIHAREVPKEIPAVFGGKVFDEVISKSIQSAEALAASLAVVE